MSIVKAVKARKSANRNGHKWQKRNALSDMSTRLTNRVQLQRMSDMARWIAEHQRGGYRYLERYTRRGFGWWQHIGTGNFDTIKPTPEDYETLKRLYAVLQDAAGLDSEILALLLEVFEHRGKMDAALSRLLTLIRRRANE